MSDKKELWELEGFKSYEEWKKNEDECTKRAIDNGPALIELCQEMFEDPACRRILGLDNPERKI